MNTLRLLVTLAILALGCTAPLSAADNSVLAKPGYTVMTEISFDETGTPESARLVESDDPTGDHALDQLALALSRQDKQPPHLKDGKPVKFKARRPFHFPVEGDAGAAANANRPRLAAGNQVIPAYPEDLAEKGVIGGAIVELTIQADGQVQSVRTLRASQPEFGAAAEAALKQWKFAPATEPAAPATSRWNAAIGFTTAGRDLELTWRLAPRPCIGSFIVGRAPPSAPAAEAAKPEPAPAGK